VDCRFARHTGRFDPRLVGEITRILGETGTTILHTHDYKSDIVGLAVRRRRVILLGTPHGWSNAPDIKLRLYQLLDRLALRRFDHVAPLSARLDESLRGIAPERRTLIPNFVDLSRLPEPAGHDGAAFCYVGRLAWLKRIEDAVTALRYVKDDRIRLEIVGDGPERRRLERCAGEAGVGDRVTFHGFRNDALSVVNGSAALVLPSLTEGVSRIAMEAMALERPVIGSDIPGIREVVENGVTGILVPVRSPRAIAEAMDLLAGDPAGRASMGRAARRYIERERSAAAIVPRYENLYERLAGTVR
jgi:glycosyltransferase involved in cell wall biosynthesis